jgi:hypothetical protein
MSDFSDRESREVPSPELLEADADFLSRTGIPYQYRAAKAQVAEQHRFVTGSRPSNAGMVLRRYEGVVYGIEATVQALFGYLFIDHAIKVLGMAIDRLPAVEAERAAAWVERDAERTAKANEVARRVLARQEQQ